MVDQVLRELDVWYKEPDAQSGDRIKLLSKLAVIELCGWIEGELDRLALVAEGGRLNDGLWVKSHVLDKTSGLSYVDHFRPMLVKLAGEVLVRRVEANLAPSDLDQLKSVLGTLWKLRCSYAHADMIANTQAQQVFYAPSWAINQYGIIKRLLHIYEQKLAIVLV